MLIQPKNEPERYEGVEIRVQFFGVLLMAALAVLCARLWSLQVLNLSEFTALAEHNRVSQTRLASDRGLIFARDNAVLADNRASADVVFVPGDCPEDRLDAVCGRLAEITSTPAEWVRAEVAKFKRSPFTQIIIKRDLTKADRIRVEEHQYELPGVTIIVHPQRRYLHGETAGQLLGYLGEINQNELDAWKDENYWLGDLVGKDGIERQYERLLHGKDGYMVVTKYASGQPQLITDALGQPRIAERDTRGHLLEQEAPPVMPRSGRPLHLTLDLELQKRCENLLAGVVGAIVVMDADTGAVLAMASTPNYDPGVFVTRGHDTERADLLKGGNPNRMIHRAYRGIYPPGSVFKVLLASAALEEGTIKPGSTFFCPGQYELPGGSRAWHCWKHSGHGTADVVDALAFSCDVFFYNVGVKLGVDKISKWCHAVGLGEKTGIDLPGEMPGLIPDAEWKAKLNADKDRSEQRWYDGDTVNLSIGQGSATATPLQCAALTACIVNGGYRVRPYLCEEFGPKKSERLFSESTIKTVVGGMRKCVQQGPKPPTGTGYRAHIDGFDIIGKTGSAQVASQSFQEKYKGDEESIPYEMREHAWFVAGVLDREPKIALCVLVEHGLHGAQAAAPYARDVIDFFYTRNPAPVPPAVPAPDAAPAPAVVSAPVPAPAPVAAPETAAAGRE